METKKVRSAKVVSIQTFDNVAIATANNDTYLFFKPNKDNGELLVFKQLRWKECFIKIRRSDKETFFDICREIHKKID